MILCYNYDGGNMKLVYNDKRIQLSICNSFFNRLLGFMFKKQISEAKLFPHCNSIHTFFMRCNIDVLLLDKDDIIRYYYHNFPKNRIILPKRKISKVIELPVDYFDIKINSKIELDTR